MISHYPAYDLIKHPATGRKFYIAACVIGLKRKLLRRGFMKASEAIAYSQRVKTRALRWVERAKA